MSRRVRKLSLSPDLLSTPERVGHSACKSSKNFTLLEPMIEKCRATLVQAPHEAEKPLPGAWASLPPPLTRWHPQQVPVWVSTAVHAPGESCPSTVCRGVGVGGPREGTVVRKEGVPGTPRDGLRKVEKRCL